MVPGFVSPLAVDINAAKPEFPRILDSGLVMNIDEY